MAEISHSGKGSKAILQIRDLHVYYGQSHALQGVELTLQEGVHAVVGRNGMGKTTLCNAIMGLLPVQRGSIRFDGKNITGQAPHQIAAGGIAFCPQGRRLWPSLSVDEHLQLADSGNGAWTLERIYETFPRLAERRSNGGGQLSGGEQQMLAISRALLQDPHLLVLDEPVEGLAPVIVDLFVEVLKGIAVEGHVAILLVEQNIAVATSVADDVAIMVNGKISQVIPAMDLADDRALQERLLGVGRHAHEEVAPQGMEHNSLVRSSSTRSVGVANAWSVDARPVDKQPIEAQSVEAPSEKASFVNVEPNKTPLDTNHRKRSGMRYVPPTRWSPAHWQEHSQATVKPLASVRSTDKLPATLYKARAVSPVKGIRAAVVVAGTFDTKGLELRFLRDQLLERGLRVHTVDLSTSGKPSSTDFPPHVIAAWHARGAGAVMSGERGTSVRAMSEAFARWIDKQPDIQAVISAGGSGGTALVTPGMQQLPVGVPKVMVSTVASGDVSQYVGAADIMMMYSVTDVQGLNSISRQVLGNAAHAVAGMVSARQSSTSQGQGDAEEFCKPALGITMFGVTTSAVQQLTSLLDEHYDCLVFHATGTGGQSMEKLADNKQLAAVVDLTTTEVADMLVGGVFAADSDRFGAFKRNNIPYVGSVGAVDMVNFGSRDSVPEKFSGRLFVEHNPQVTLMRTSVEENTAIGHWIGERLNAMAGPVRFLIPEGGVSALDAPGAAFHDPQASQALFTALESVFKATPAHRLIRLPHHINDSAFATAAAEALNSIHTLNRRIRHAAN